MDSQTYRFIDPWINRLIDSYVHGFIDLWMACYHCVNPCGGSAINTADKFCPSFSFVVLSANSGVPTDIMWAQGSLCDNCSLVALLKQ